jgi:hypothetical protein
MDLKNRFQEVLKFLKPYQRIWQNEIMLLYPEPFVDYPKDWIEELASIRNKEDVIRLEKKDVFSLIKNPGLIHFYQQVEGLSRVSEVPTAPPMPEDKFTFLFTIPKKQHEIRKLAPFVKAFYEEKKVEEIIDIGGGIGLLAQTLNNQYNLKITTLDMNPTLQKTGSERHEKNAKNKDNKVQYITTLVDNDNLEFKKLLSSHHMTLGLHTCGPLANAQITTSAQSKIKGIINFGCCYHKLFDEDQNLSKVAQDHPDKLIMNNFALTLASRGHRKMDEKDYDLKLKVKFYRYCMHFLLHDEYGMKKLVTLGNSSPKLYEESFGTYALEQLKRIGVKPHHTKEELDHYFSAPARQEMIWKMMAGGLIRNALGRVLEMYILLDRACYLEEHGYKVDLIEFFDEGTSPRNIGLVGENLT